MGKFFNYSDSNFRTFNIDTTAGTIQRPERYVYVEDMIGGIVTVDGENCIAVSCKDSTTTVTAYIVVAGTVTALTYTKATDSFALGSTSLTNVMVDKYGRVKQLNPVAAAASNDNHD